MNSTVRISKPEQVRIETDRGYGATVAADEQLLVSTEVSRLARGRLKVTLRWVPAADLRIGQQLLLWQRPVAEQCTINQHEHALGWLLGEIVGDGGYHPDVYRTYVRFWGDSGESMASLAAGFIARMPQEYRAPISACAPPRYNLANKSWTLSSRKLCALAGGLILPRSKKPTAALDECSLSFRAGFLRGLFDADGSVQGSVDRGLSVRLAQSDKELLSAVQSMLLQFGIASTAYFERRPSGLRLLPSGPGRGKDWYVCQADHELVVTKQNVRRFDQVVGFYEPAKAKRLMTLLTSYRSRGPYRESFAACVSCVRPVLLADQNPQTERVACADRGFPFVANPRVRQPDHAEARSDRSMDLVLSQASDLAVWLAAL
jgi:ribonucleotide reductase class II